MWCDGLKSTKAKRTMDMDSDDEGELMGTRKKRKKPRRRKKLMNKWNISSLQICKKNTAAPHLFSSGSGRK